jgi:hypothetical protein
VSWRDPSGLAPEEEKGDRTLTTETLADINKRLVSLSLIMANELEPVNMCYYGFGQYSYNGSSEDAGSMFGYGSYSSKMIPTECVDATTDQSGHITGHTHSIKFKKYLYDYKGNRVGLAPGESTITFTKATQTSSGGNGINTENNSTGETVAGETTTNLDPINKKNKWKEKSWIVSGKELGLNAGVSSMTTPEGTTLFAPKYESFIQSFEVFISIWFDSYFTKSWKVSAYICIKTDSDNFSSFVPTGCFFFHSNGNVSERNRFSWVSSNNYFLNKGEFCSEKPSWFLPATGSAYLEVNLQYFNGGVPSNRLFGTNFNISIIP